MAKLVTIYGGSGFLGRQIARLMAAQGWRVRVACRRPNQAGEVRIYGAVGQVEPVPCNVRDDFSVTAAMMEADAVINCVGVLNNAGRNTFEAVNDEAAGRIARIAAELGVANFVQISAIGADLDGDSAYARSKGRGEAAVLESRPDAVILRPSVIFGPSDHFYNRLGGMAAKLPVLVVPGLSARFQPVYVDDVAQAAMLAADGKAAPGVYELGGPDVMTMREIVHQVLRVTDRRRLVLPLPGFAAGILGGVFDTVQWLTGGLVTNRVLTRDQARQLRGHAVVGEPAGRDAIMGFAELGIAPTAAGAVIPEYLWRFRPSGQYEAMKDSAKNLRSN